MPELPEVETVRRRLESLLLGKEICEVELRSACLRCPIPPGLTRMLSHSRISAAGRVGKYLLIHLSRGTWIVHLGMSGRFLFGAPTNAKDAKHDHLVLRMSGGLTVRYNDFRKFGSFAASAPETLATHPSLSRLGIDALADELNGEVLFELLSKRTAPIKTSLLDQRLICGIGNIYACESRYWSNIHPSRPSCSLRRLETQRVALALRRVLLSAVEVGGSTLPDYAGTSGALGSFHHQFAVFGRHGFPCPRCDFACVSRVVLCGRTTYYCPDMSKGEAEALMAVILKPQNQEAGQTQKPVYTFGVYLDEVYLSMCRRKWKESTRMTTEPRISFHLTPAFESHVLRSVTREQMQEFLDQKAANLSRSTVDHLRWDLNAIFKTALSDGLVDCNTAAALFTPLCKPEHDKKVMTPEEIRIALGVLDLRERLMYRMAVFDGMRPGEILAVKLGKISEQSIFVDQRVYKGNIDTP